MSACRLLRFFQMCPAEGSMVTMLWCFLPFWSTTENMRCVFCAYAHWPWLCLFVLTPRFCIRLFAPQRGIYKPWYKKPPLVSEQALTVYPEVKLCCPSLHPSEVCLEYCEVVLSQKGKYMRLRSELACCGDMFLLHVHLTDDNTFIKCYTLCLLKHAQPPCPHTCAYYENLYIQFEWCLLILTLQETFQLTFAITVCTSAPWTDRVVPLRRNTSHYV